MQQRRDELEAYSQPGTGKLLAAAYDPLYNNELTLSGARSRLGEFLHGAHVTE